MQFRKCVVRRSPRLEAKVFIAIGLALVTPVSFAEAQATGNTNPNRIVVSTRATIPVIDVATNVSRSYRGATDVAGREALAEFKGIAETPQEFAALQALPGVTAKLGAETIIGPDNRVRINPTTSFPARATVLITFSAGRCTGWLIGAHTVVTAGHCVHPGGGGSFYPRSSYRLYPGRNGAASPYGSCTARWLASVTGWTVSRSDEYDYAAIRMNCSIGNITGWYGFFWQSASLTGLPTTINGYPGDKPLTQWRSSDTVRVTQTRRVFYRNDTVGGVSGAPVWYNRTGCGICSMAVHAYGTYNGPPFSTNNHGTRITQAVFNNLIAWRNAP
jgi:glutamyl endopeptidase